MASKRVISRSEVLRLKEAVDLQQVIGQYVKLRTAGKTAVGLCPFHREKTGSFTTWKTHYVCFSCEAKGDVFTFLRAIEGWTFQQAAEYLAEHFGISLETKYVSRAQRQLAQETDAFCSWWWERRRRSLMEEQDSARQTEREISREIRNLIETRNEYLLRGHREGSAAWLGTLGTLDCELEMDLIPVVPMIEAWEWAECCARLISAIDDMDPAEKYRLFRAQATATERATWRAAVVDDQYFSDTWIKAATINPPNISV